MTEQARETKTMSTVTKERTKMFKTVFIFIIFLFKKNDHFANFTKKKS